MKLPKRTEPRRPNVADHYYNPATRELTVHFGSGRSYRYEGISAAKAVEFHNAPSRGTYLHSRIIPHHPHTEITQQRDDWREAVTPRLTHGFRQEYAGASLPLADGAGATGKLASIECRRETQAISWRRGAVPSADR